MRRIRAGRGRRGRAGARAWLRPASLPRAATLPGVLALLLGTAPALSAQADGGRNALWYLGNYGREILVWDEASEEVVDRIPVRNPLPSLLRLSPDGARLYVQDGTFEHVEIVDLAGKRTVDEFTLSGGRTRSMIWGFEPHPGGEWAVILVQDRTRLVDRYEISDPVILRYDFEAGQVTDTIPWPDEEPSIFAEFRFSPDGESLYVFSEDLIVLDAGDFSEVDRWEISEPLEPGTGVMSLPFARDPYQERDGIYTGLFRMTDPVQNRRLMGIATVDLAEREVDFRALGPSEGVGFRLSPDGTKAYGLRSEIGHYELWKFDLEAGRIADRIAFPGRPRMALMPSADGRRLFIYNAGSTIDVYDEATFEHLRTIELEADMIGVAIMPDPEPGGGG